jgi:hypothetical protein
LPTRGAGFDAGAANFALVLQHWLRRLVFALLALLPLSVTASDDTARLNSTTQARLVEQCSNRL